DVEILEARYIFVLMKKEYRISRSIRMQWYLEHLNKTVTVPSISEMCKDGTILEPELQVLSVVPHEQPPEWKPESSHLYKYLVTAHSTLLFLTHNYCIVYCLDMSPSLSAVDIQHGEVMIDGVFASLRKSLDGLTKPFRIPGSMYVFQPEIYVTVIAHTPFFTTPAQQVLVQGWHVTQDNLGIFLNNVQQQLEKLENTVAEVAGIAYDQIEAESEKLVGGLFEESSDVPMVAPDAGFVNMLRYGMLALRLLPESSCKNLIVVTDGVVASPDVNVLDSVLAQLRSGTVSCSFLHVGSPFHPHCCAGLVPYVDLLQFVADATCGAYLNIIPEINVCSKNSMNIYHEKILMWKFQKINHGHLSLISHFFPSSSVQRHPSPLHGDEWHVSNACFYGSHEPHLLRKKQEEDNLSTTLHSILCCRLREGYTIKNINIRDNSVEVNLVLPWKNHIYIDYTVSCQWPPLPSSESIGSGIVHYSISIEAPYEFLHDITCLLKKPFKSQYRQSVVSRFWTTLKNLARSDQLLVHLNSFPSNPATYTIPESIRSGMPVFYLPANSSSALSASHGFHSMTEEGQPICLLEPSVWKKWLHTHRVGLVLQHDRPLPRHLHLANSSGRFQVIQCRQAAAALYSLLKDWSSFVLIENHSYVKLIHGDAEKPPTSFYIIRVTSKPPCVVINVAFLNGTPGSLRYKIVQQLKDRIAQLTFPQRPSAKEPPQHATRKWSDVNCCVLLHKPVEKILIRRFKFNITLALINKFSLGYQPIVGQTKTRTAGGGLLTTLSRYLHHRRWVWSAQSGADTEEEAIARVLATITKMRLQEGFSFAHSTAGIINMVLEVQMKCETECSINRRNKDNNEVNESSEYHLQPCVIQYVMFPPHTTSSNKCGSEDDGTDEVEVPDAENDGELQIITECWIEPQHGLVVNCPPERDYMEHLPYHKLADVDRHIQNEHVSKPHDGNVIDGDSNENPKLYCLCNFS
ncbi:hypothetical protein L9F63_013524, partial [Diploptera punctata]